MNDMSAKKKKKTGSLVVGWIFVAVDVVGQGFVFFFFVNLTSAGDNVNR